MDDSLLTIVGLIFVLVLIGGIIYLIAKLGDRIIDSTIIKGGFIHSKIDRTKRSISRKIGEHQLTGCTWMVANDFDDDMLYTFRAKNQLIITTNGNVKFAKYELIVDNNSILISKDELDEHFNMQIIDDEFLFLNKVSTKDWLLLANKSKFVGESKSEICEKAILFFK